MQFGNRCTRHWSSHDFGGRQNLPRQDERRFPAGPTLDIVRARVVVRRAAQFHAVRGQRRSSIAVGLRAQARAKSATASQPNCPIVSGDRSCREHSHGLTLSAP
jgi:hypothetical protein